MPNYCTITWSLYSKWNFSRRQFKESKWQFNVFTYEPNDSMLATRKRFMKEYFLRFNCIIMIKMNKNILLIFFCVKFFFTWIYSLLNFNHIDFPSFILKQFIICILTYNNRLPILCIGLRLKLDFINDASLIRDFS